MLLNSILSNAANHARLEFVRNCPQFDIPRLEATVYPEGLTIEQDLPYAAGKALPAPLAQDAAADGATLCCSDRNLDIYTPENAKPNEIFLMIHGGAFVYGCKELNKEFCMHLALKSGIAVANMNYRLMPSTDLQGVLQDIFYAIGFLCEKGFDTFHTVGDSAGGYLCLITAILINSPKAREDFGLKGFPYQIKCPSTSPICGDHVETPLQFAGFYFDPDKKLPKCIYDLADAAKIYGCPPVVLTTGDQDMMLKQNEQLYKKLQAIGVPVDYYCAITEEPDRPMHHVYAIAHPTWPEGIKTIDMTIANAKR